MVGRERSKIAKGRKLYINIAIRDREGRGEGGVCPHYDTYTAVVNHIIMSADAPPIQDRGRRADARAIEDRDTREGRAERDREWGGERGRERERERDRRRRRCSRMHVRRQEFSACFGFSARVVRVRSSGRDHGVAGLAAGQTLVLYLRSGAMDKTEPLEESHGVESL